MNSSSQRHKLWGGEVKYRTAGGRAWRPGGECQSRHGRHRTKGSSGTGFRRSGRRRTRPGGRTAGGHRASRCRRCSSSMASSSRSSASPPPHRIRPPGRQRQSWLSPSSPARRWRLWDFFRRSDWEWGGLVLREYIKTWIKNVNECL